MPTTEAELTERQRDVLRLHRAGKTPTEIGTELGVSSQGVHGHLRRLRAHGLIEGRSRASANGRAFDPSTIDTVRRELANQEAQLDAHEATIDAEIERLRDEKRAVATLRKKLRALAEGAS